MRFLVLSVPAFVAGVPLAQAQSVSINATISGEVVPGVYGRVVIGNRPPPPVVYAQPVIAQPAPVVVAAHPWRRSICTFRPAMPATGDKHCHEYHACNRPVYFVRSAEYEPGYRPKHTRITGTTTMSTRITAIMTMIMATTITGTTTIDPAGTDEPASALLCMPPGAWTLRVQRRGGMCVDALG